MTLVHAPLILALVAAALVVLSHRSATPTAAVLGFLMPLTSVPGIPYSAVVAARLVLTVILMARWSADASPRSRSRIRGVLLPIAALGALVGALGVMRNDHLATSTALSMPESAAVAFVLAGRSRAFPGLALGFVSGTVASAAVAIYQQSAGIDSGGALVARYLGLSVSSTRVSYEYAIALVILGFAVARSVSRPAHTMVRLALGALLLFALALTGGRGGLLALGFALVAVSNVASPAAQRARALALIFVAVVLAGVSGGVNLPVVSRIIGSAGLSGGSNVGVSNGRSALWSESLQAISSHPFGGLGIDNFISQYGVEPHASPVFFGVAAGAFGLAVALGLVLRLWIIALVPRRRLLRTSSLAVGILAVLAVRAVLEPTSPLVGVEEVSLLAICIRLLGEEGGQAESEAEAGVGLEVLV